MSANPTAALAADALKGRTALVTGGSRGIGAAIAKHLAAAGATVAVNYNANRERAEAVVAEIKGAGGNAFAIGGSVDDPAAVEKLFAELDTHFDGSLDILVNNAGVAEMAPITEATLELFDKTMGVNVRGVFDVTRHAAKRLNDNGRIIIIGSGIGDRAMLGGTSVYAMSKSAVQGLARGWAHDLGQRGITSNVVQPGLTDTDMNPNHEDNPMAAALTPSTTLKRYASADEIAAVVAFIASPAASYITGQTITADGGINA